MSIVTKNGDLGTTGLMYNRRISKCHPRVEAYGTVDELNAALGVARAAAPGAGVGESLLQVQRDLVALMGELATAAEDLPRYARDGYPPLNAACTQRVEVLIRSVEAANPSFRGWATPGATVLAAALDMARTVCRRAERHICSLDLSDQLANPEILVYLNRLSDLLWLLARHEETRAEANSKSCPDPPSA